MTTATVHQADPEPSRQWSKKRGKEKGKSIIPSLQKTSWSFRSQCTSSRLHEAFLHSPCFSCCRLGPQNPCSSVWLVLHLAICPHITGRLLAGKAVPESTVILALRSWRGLRGEGRQRWGRSWVQMANLRHWTSGAPHMPSWDKGVRDPGSKVLPQRPGKDWRTFVESAE